MTTEYAYPTHAHDQRGMTLRDYFAGQALAGLLAGPSGDEWIDPELTKAAYEIADAMMAERDGR